MNTRIRLIKMAAKLQLGIPKPPPPVSQPMSPTDMAPPPPPPPAEAPEPAGVDYSRSMKQLLKTYGLSAVRNPNKIIKGLTESPADISQYVDQPPPPPPPTPTTTQQ